jgi:serine/threonine-protein kinase RsbW
VERAFKRSFDSLDEIFRFTESFFVSEAIDTGLLHDVNFAVEELFTNMVKYNAPGSCDIRLGLDRSDGALVVRLVDSDSRPFDVTKSPPVDISKPLSEREPGGLGLHLVKKVVDTLDYQHADGETRITFTRRLR